jgi:molecular chaperone HscB
MLKVLDSAVPVACWSCAVAHNDSTLFCPHCSKIQPPPGGDYFSVFGLEPRLNLDLAALEHEFHRLSRKVHPDRFARALENERQWSLADTALLNDAYRTLKDPLHRTEYLLKLEGAEIGEEHSGKDRKDPSRVPADLLEEVFELNMQLEEARMNKKMGEDDAALAKELEQTRQQLQARYKALDQELKKYWDEWDAVAAEDASADARGSVTSKMVDLLNRRTYIRNLVRDVNDVLGY